MTSSNNESNKLPETFSDSASVIADSLRHFTVNGLRMGRVQVFNNGIVKYEQLLESLQDAQKTIDLEYFIFRNTKLAIVSRTANRKSINWSAGSFYERWLGEL